VKTALVHGHSFVLFGQHASTKITLSRQVVTAGGWRATLPKTPDKIEKIRFPIVNENPHFCASHRLCLLTTNGLTFYQKC